MTQPSLTSGRTGGGRGRGGRRHIAAYLVGVPVLRLQAPPPSCHQPSGVFTTPPSKKKKKSHAVLARAASVPTAMARRGGGAGDRGRAGGRAGARREMQNHVTGSAPPTHHVGEQFRPNPQRAGETRCAGRGAGASVSRDVDLATGSDCVTSTSGRFSHGFGRSRDSGRLRFHHVIGLSLLFLDSFSLLVDLYHLIRAHLFRWFFSQWRFFPSDRYHVMQRSGGGRLGRLQFVCLRMRHVSESASVC